MKYNHTVKSNGVYYLAGTEVPEVGNKAIEPKKSETKEIKPEPKKSTKK